MNKKSISGLLAVVMIAAVAAFNVSLNSQKETLSDLAMENVEALADESSGESSTYCRKNVYSRSGYRTTPCKTCIPTNNKYGTRIGTCIKP